MSGSDSEGGADGRVWITSWVLYAEVAVLVLDSCGV